MVKPQDGSMKSEVWKDIPMNQCACGCGGLTKSTFRTGHHRRVKGSKPPVPAKPLDERIKNSSTVMGSGCWEWKLSLDKDGYGSMKVKGKSLRASRVSYQVFKGEIPEGHVVSAKCKNASCVNPEHLGAITAEECVRRGDSSPLKNFADYYERRRNSTHCANGHPWNEENTRHAKDGRICRACVREQMRGRRESSEYLDSERSRSRELYAENRDKILERKREYNRAQYAKAKAEGTCVFGGGKRCDNPAEPGRVQCEYHLELSAARTWGIRKHPLKDIYRERGIQNCWICGCDFDAETRMHNDHLIPRSLGGPDEAWNLAPACQSCNSRRCNLPLNITMEVAVYADVAVSDFPKEFQSYLI